MPRFTCSFLEPCSSLRSEFWAMSAAAREPQGPLAEFCPSSPQGFSIYGPPLCSPETWFLAVLFPFHKFREINSRLLLWLSAMLFKRQLCFSGRALRKETRASQEDSSSFLLFLFWFTLKSQGLFGEGHNQIKIKWPGRWETKTVWFIFLP